MFNISIVMRSMVKKQVTLYESMKQLNHTLPRPIKQNGNGFMNWHWRELSTMIYLSGVMKAGMKLEVCYIKRTGLCAERSGGI